MRPSERPVTELERIKVLQYLGTPNPKKFLKMLDADGLSHIDAVAMKLRATDKKR